MNIMIWVKERFSHLGHRSRRRHQNCDIFEAYSINLSGCHGSQVAFSCNTRLRGTVKKEVKGHDKKAVSENGGAETLKA
jgi:hypothetical protein